MLFGIVAVAVIGRLPRELVAAVLGRGGSVSGLCRAVAAGVALDLCNHGILMVGMSLYKRGASLGQTLAFLIASPWNSLSLTLILAALIGWGWMLHLHRPFDGRGPRHRLDRRPVGGRRQNSAPTRMP